MMNLEVGTKLFANYGAMSATIDAVVEEIQADGWVVFRDVRGGVCSAYNVRIETIRDDMAAPKGSPIGVFYNVYEN